MKKFNFAGLYLSLLATFSLSISSAFAGGSGTNHSHNDAGGYYHTHGGSSSHGSGGYGSGNYGSGNGGYGYGGSSNYGSGGYGYGGYGGSISGGGYYKETLKMVRPTYTPQRQVYCPLGGCGHTQPIIQPYPGNQMIGSLPNTNIINDSFKNINVKNIYGKATSAASGAGGLLGLALPLIGAHILSGGIDRKRPIVNYYPAHSVTAKTKPSREVVRVIDANHRMPIIRYNHYKKPAASNQQRRIVSQRLSDVCNIKNGACTKNSRELREQNYGDVSYDNYGHRSYEQGNDGIEIIGGREHGQEENLLAIISSYDDGGETYKVDY